jgi:uncharacterized protein with beta-barrel porin domain
VIVWGVGTVLAAERASVRAGKAGEPIGGRLGRRAGLLATTSLVSAVASLALFAPPQIRPAEAACAIDVTGNSGPVTNPAAIDCININSNVTVTGNVTNTSAGVISAGNQVGTIFGIFIGGTITGSVVNNGKISSSSATGILVSGTANIAGGITNTGGINAAFAGIAVQSPSFTGGITNSGTISGGGIAGAISVFQDSIFAGGIVNSGQITDVHVGIFVNTVSAFSGGITNSGTISAVFGSAIAVSNVSSFSGGISNTGLLIGDFAGISIGNVTNFAGGITNSGTIIGSVDVNNASTFSGNIVNSAGGTISGDYAIYIGNTLTFAGGVTNNGTLAASAGDGIALSSVSLFSGNITNSGKITGGTGGVGLLHVGTFTGGITNSGSISANGAGVYLNLVTNFSGGISNGGMITAGSTGISVRSSGIFSGGIANTGTISGTVGIVASNNSGAISIFDSGIIIGAGGTAIDLSQNAPGNTLTLGPGYQISGLVRGQGADTFQLGGTGSGAFDLSTVGATQQYRGFTTFNVVSGTWTVSNTFGQSQAWNVNGGTLAGTGNLNSVNVNKGGTLEPGTIGVPGTFMTINGNLAFQSGAMYLVNIGPNSASRANVSGTVTLNGAVEGVLAPGSYNNKTSYDILDPSSISGAFTGFSAPGFTGTLTYTPTDVLLKLTAALGAGMSLPQNQQNAANTVNGFFNDGGTLPASFLPVFSLSGANLSNALSQLDGEDATGAERGAFELMDEFLGLMVDPFLDGRGGAGPGGAVGALGFAPDQQAGLPPDIALAYADALKAPPTFTQRWTTWGAGFGGSSQSNGDPAVGSNNVTTSTYGYAAGMDYHYSPDTVLGFALAGGGTNWNLAQGLGTGRSDAFQAGLYGVTHAGPAYLAAAVAFANNWFTTDRTAMGDQLTANFQGQNYGGRLEGGYRFAVPYSHGLAGITPYAAVQAQDFQTPSYSETDPISGGFGLSYSAMNGTDTRSELGSRFDDLTALGTVPVMLRAKVAWAHDWVSDPALNASFESLPGTGFTVNGAPIPHDSALASAGAQMWFTPDWSFIAKFDGEFAAGSQTYAGSGTLRYTW